MTEPSKHDWSAGKPMSEPLKEQIAGDHYKSLAIQPAEYCQRNRLPYCESSVIRYVTRHRDKNGREDIEKAIHCLQLLLEFEYPKENYEKTIREAVETLRQERARGSGFFSASSEDWKEFMSNVDLEGGSHKDIVFSEIDLRTAADWGWRLARKQTLESCPWCQGKMKVEWEPIEPLVEGDTNRHWFVECQHCGATGPRCQKEREAMNYLPERGVNPNAV